MIITALISLAAGALSVLAPCVLPFLPVIVGGSLRGERRRPYIVAAALVVSLLVFTILLKATTVFINVDPRVWTTASGVLVILLGLSMLFPDAWSKLVLHLGIDRKSHQLLDRASAHHSGTISAILTGVALGPVFSSCSPTYAWVIATVLPVSLSLGLVYLSLYCVGVAIALLAIALAGRKLISKLQWASNPRGWFQRIIAIGFILVGIFVATGIDKTVQTWATSNIPSLSRIEEKLIPNNANNNADAAQDGAQLRNADQAQQAPEFTSIQEWINSEPLKLQQLRGKVVLVDFWTYSCINCIRTQPYLNAWYDTYHNQGLEIIGIHAPEFAFERVPDNVKRAVQQAGIKYPVALDNDFATWNAYHNQYWPAKYLIDQQGRIRYFHAGEGDYDGFESAIRTLLGSHSAKSQISNTEHAADDQSPETYLGTNRAQGYVGDVPLHNGTARYHASSTLNPDNWTLHGVWKVDSESITAAEHDAKLTYRFRGQEMYLVLGGQKGAKVEITVQGVPNPNDVAGADVHQGTVTIDGERLYRLVKLPHNIHQATVTLTVPEGVRANAFTFGG